MSKISPKVIDVEGNRVAYKSKDDILIRIMGKYENEVKMNASPDKFKYVKQITNTK